MDKSTFLAKGCSMLLPARAWDLILWGWCFSWYKEYYPQTPVTNLCTETPALKMTVCATVLAVGKSLRVFSMWEKQEWKKGTSLPLEEWGDGWEGAVSTGGCGVAAPRGTELWSHPASQASDPHRLENYLKKRESWQQENIIHDLCTIKLTIKPWTREASQSEILGEKGKTKSSCNPCS